MGKKEKNSAFICIACLQYVLPLQNGSYRNHCPYCLVSLHVDNKPGDRNNSCYGLMTPNKVIYTRHKGWQIIHHCNKCGLKKINKIAEGNVQPDVWDLIIRLSQPD